LGGEDLSQEQSWERWEKIALTAGGLFGLTLILLVNVPPGLSSLTCLFASINIILFLCILFSPVLLIYGAFESDRWNLSRVAIVTSYILSAVIIGSMIAYLARGDNYYSGLVVIPNEVSWVVVAIIAILLLIPLINFFSALPLAIWLGSLLYDKVYQTSHLSRTLIGSPLFAPPLSILIAFEISRTIHSRRNIAYTFDKTDGTLTQHRPPKAKVPIKKLLATMTIFLLASSLVAAGFGMWNELEEAKVCRVSDFQLSTCTYYEGSYGYHLMVSFSLVNVRDKTIATEGIAEFSIFNKNGTSVYSNRFSFSKKSFSHQEAIKKWICTRYISGQGFLSSIISEAKSVTALPSVVESINSGYAILKVCLTDDGEILNSTTSTRYLLYTDTLMQFYFQSDRILLQAELDKQWPIKASISDYFRMGNYCWAVVGRTGGEIIFYPGKIYDWYILQSIDGGNYWDISWKGDSYPLFKAELLSEKEIRVTTPYKIFTTRDEGETWE
jgi:hypothetical protein